jgi:hypothetical protein
MSATKDMLFDCFDSGVVPVDPKDVAVWAESVGSILDGMPMTHRHEGRFGPVDVPVIPLTVAQRVSELLPETHDTLGWMLDVFAEARL